MKHRTTVYLKSLCSEKQMKLFYVIFLGTARNRECFVLILESLSFGGKFTIISNLKTCTSLFACSWIDSIHCLYRQRKVVLSTLVNIFKCVRWLVFELLDLHPFSEGNGRFVDFCVVMYFQHAHPFLHPFVRTMNFKMYLSRQNRQSIL